jgi:hypothetical protein
MQKQGKTDALIETPKSKLSMSTVTSGQRLHVISVHTKIRKKTDIMIENHEKNDTIICSHLWPEVTDDFDRGRKIKYRMEC